jgi:hypothetical protein
MTEIDEPGQVYRCNKHRIVIPVSAIWLRRIGEHVEVLAEIDGKFRLVTREQWEGNFSNIANASGADRWPVDRL